MKTTVKKTSRGKVVEYEMKGSDEWETGTIMNTQPELTGKYSDWLNREAEVENENPVYINWDYLDQLRELPQVTEEVSDEEHVVLLTSEQKQAKKVIEANKREIENVNILSWLTG